MKKFLCLLLSVVMVLSLFTACGEDKTEDSSKKDDESSAVIDSNADTLNLSKLSDIAEEASKGSIITADTKITLETKEALADEDYSDSFSKFGWTNNKIDLSLKVSVLTTADEKGKLSLNVLGGNDTEIAGLNDIVFVKEDIFVPTAEITEILNTIVDLVGEEAGAGADDAIKSITDAYKDKKYIQINIPSLISMAGIEVPTDGTAAEDFDISEIFYDATGVKLDEFVNAVKDIAKNESVAATAEELTKDINVVSTTDNTIEMHITEKDVVAFCDAVVSLVTKHADVFAGEMFEAMKNSYTEADKDEVFTEDTKKEAIDEIASLGDEWKDGKAELENMFSKTGINYDMKFTVDDADNGFFDVTNSISVYDKTESGNKIALSSNVSADKSSESIADISATDCISLTDFIAQISNLFSGSDYEDDYDFDENYDYDFDDDYDYDFGDDYDYDFDDDYDYSYDEDYDFDLEDDYDFDFDYDDSVSSDVAF